jgi:hypothetical protein
MMLVGLALVVNVLGCVAFERLSYVAGSPALLGASAAALCGLIWLMCLLVARVSLREQVGLAGLCRHCFGSKLGSVIAMITGCAVALFAGGMLSAAMLMLGPVISGMPDDRWKRTVMEAATIGVMLSAGWWNWRQLAGISKTLLLFGGAMIFGLAYGRWAPVPATRVYETAVEFPAVILVPLLVWSCGAWRFSGPRAALMASLMIALAAFGVAVASARTVTGAIETSYTKSVRDYVTAAIPWNRSSNRYLHGKAALLAITVFFPVGFLLYASCETLREIVGAHMAAIAAIAAVWIGMRWFWSVIDVFEAARYFAALGGMIAGSGFGDRRSPVVACVAVLAGSATPTPATAFLAALAVMVLCRRIVR